MTAFIHKFLFYVGILLLLMATAVSRVSAQVSIAPVALYMNDNNKTGRVVVRNSTNKPMELTIELFFGYPDTDPEGEVFLNVPDEIPANQPSAKEWVRVYPRHLVLPPQEQQTIRFAARPPANLPPGEYWVRPAISSRDAQETDNSASQGITTDINLVKRTFLSLNYRHGRVNTGISIQELRAEQEGEHLQLFARLNRNGNAAYLGHCNIRVYDISNNKMEKHQRREIAVYHQQLRKFDLETSDLAPGRYRIELTLSTGDRTGKNEAILAAPTVSRDITVTLK